jgi:hypothetical protein
MEFSGPRLHDAQMRTTKLLLGIVAIAVVSSCKTDPAMQQSATTPSSASAAAPSASGDDIGAPKYAVCKGQGGNPAQLAPGFLDQMETCQRADATPANTLADVAGDGEIIASKGDCQFEHGITCHFHTSMEFVTTGKLKDEEHRVGEMHCIVPSANASSPSVYGAHVRCQSGTTPAGGTRSCSKQLLQALDQHHCQGGWKCCDNGTLTKPVAKQSPAELKLRPDFRICADDAIEIDCGLFHGMHGHTANVVGLGEEITGTFNTDEMHAKAH